MPSQEDTMRCERCGGLKVEDHFCGTAIDVPAWDYDGVRCINCGSITALIRGEREVRNAPHKERSSRLGQIYAEMFSFQRITPSELQTRRVCGLGFLRARMNGGEKTRANLTWRLSRNQTISSTVAENCIAMTSH
jgi:hypothetical protein